jgi:hypothetical protein
VKVKKEYFHNFIQIVGRTNFFVVGEFLSEAEGCTPLLEAALLY